MAADDSNSCFFFKFLWKQTIHFFTKWVTWPILPGTEYKINILYYLATCVKPYDSPTLEVFVVDVCRLCPTDTGVQYRTWQDVLIVYPVTGPLSGDTFRDKNLLFFFFYKLRYKHDTRWDNADICRNRRTKCDVWMSKWFVFVFIKLMT
jgi:hypothetical protein